jgi:hypothetical protein
MQYANIRVILITLSFTLITVALMSGCSSDKNIVVPNVVGMNQSTAEAAIRGAGLKVGDITEEYNATESTDKIIRQEPAAGNKVAKDNAVAVTVLKGDVSGKEVEKIHSGDDADNLHEFTLINEGGVIGILSSCKTINGNERSITLDGDGKYSWMLPHESMVTIANYASPGYRFNGWSQTGSDDCDYNAQCVFVIRDNTTVTTHFVKQYRITLVADGDGEVHADISGGKDKNKKLVAYPVHEARGNFAIVDAGATIQVQAVANPGCHFARWNEEDYDDKQSELTFTIDSDTKLSATFISDTPGNSEEASSSEMPPKQNTINLKESAAQYLQPLDKLNLSLSSHLETGLFKPASQIGVTFQVLGKTINIDASTFAVERKSFYADPLSCCVAAQQALLQEEREWYGMIGASLEERKDNGQPREDYTPDYGNSLYEMFTWHNQQENWPRIISYKIENYVRIGKLHGFITEITYELIVDSKADYSHTRYLAPVEEFSPGRFRWAHEWMHPNTRITIPVECSILESPEFQEYREEIPEQHHEIVFNGLLGDIDGKYPLTMMFRGGTTEEQPEYRQILEVSRRLEELQESLRSVIEEEAYLCSDIRKEIQQLLGEQAFERYDERHLQTMKSEIFMNSNENTKRRKEEALASSDIAYIMDGKDYFLVFCYKPESKEIDQKVFLFKREGNNVLLIDATREGFEHEFFKDEKIWEPLSKKLKEIIESS